MSRRFIAAFVGAAFVAALAVSTASASHSWGRYHWARTANPFTIKVIDSMTAGGAEGPAWDAHLDVAIADWHASSVMNVVEEAGDSSTRTRKRCPAVSGKARSCNAEYGSNGWLGLASIWASGDHITQATAKMNDTYFNTATYNVPHKKQHVVCQEIGHDWGLGHQDESGADLGTCMDYDRALDNEHPNQHDYDQLALIYQHLDSTTTIASATTASKVPPGLAGDENAQPQRVERVDRIATSTITAYYRDGTRLIKHITWALDAPQAHRDHS